MGNIGLRELILISITFGISLIIPWVFYLLTLQRALSRCSPESRSLEPGLVWLQFIPVFGLVWSFIVVTSVSKSLHNEFARRNIAVEPYPGQSIGLAMCILLVLSFVPFVGLAYLICWIRYWGKIASLSARLKSAQSS